jgi:hypothetical protein
MATSSIILDIRANTQRALSEFKTFSSQLDNKFLVSGLKLDVVRNALSQINREFQKSLGEQGLASAQSLKAAENQAAILTNIYAGFSKTASGRIVEDFSSALNIVATRTGSTVSDIQKTLAVSPYLSRDLSQGIRQNILVDIQNLQTAARRAGLGGNTADILNKFLTGQTGGQELQESGDTLSKMLGAELSRVGGGVGTETMSLSERTRILRAALANIDIEGFAKETGGFRAVLEQFSASLFNPKAGLLGAMREFVLKTGEAPTTIFKETTKLFESIFGEEGFIKTLSRELAKAFGLRGEDTAIRFLGRGIRFITNLINGAKNLIDDILNTPIVRKVVEIIRSAFDGIVGFLRKLEGIANNPPDFPDISKESIQTFIRDIGENVRGFLRKVGAFIRGEDISDEANTGASIVGTIVDEAGKTMLTFFKEVGDALLAKTGTIALELAKVLPGTIAGVIAKGLTGAGGITGFILSALGVGGLGLGASRAFGGFRRGVLAGEGGVPGAINRFLGSPVGPLRPRARVTGSGRTRGGGGGRRTGEVSPPDLDDLLSSIRNEDGAPTQTSYRRGLRDRIRDRYSRTIAPRSQWPRPGQNLELLARRKAITEGRITPSTSVLAGTISELLTPEEILSQYSRPGTKINRYNTMFKSIDMPDQYLTQAGPLPLESAEPWTMAEGAYQPYMGEVNPAVTERKDFLTNQRRQGLIEEAAFRRKIRSRQSVRQRFAQRYGRGALLRTQMGRLGRGGVPNVPGGKFGLAMTALGLGAMALDAGQSQAGQDEFGQEIPQPKVGTGAAWGSVGMGVTQGALAGSALGPWGAAIGGVIGGGISLMDKGVRDAIGKSLRDFGSNALKWGGELAEGLKSNIFKGFETIKNFAKGIDWKQRILDIVFPGRSLLRMGAERVGLERSGRNSGFGANVKNWLANILGLKEVGGPVIRGASYIVGERGPEIYTPGETGTISSNRELNSLISGAQKNKPISSLDGGGAVFNITINATGLAGNDIAAAIQPAVMQVLDTAWSRSNSNIVTRGATII